MAAAAKAMMAQEGEASEEEEVELAAIQKDADEQEAQMRAEKEEREKQDYLEVQAMTDVEYEKARLERFALKPIMETKEINKRLHEVQQSFYNRLESRKLIKKTGKIPFMEHMTATHENPVVISEAAA